MKTKVPTPNKVNTARGAEASIRSVLAKAGLPVRELTATGGTLNRRPDSGPGFLVRVITDFPWSRVGLAADAGASLTAAGYTYTGGTAANPSIMVEVPERVGAPAYRLAKANARVVAAAAKRDEAEALYFAKVALSEALVNVGIEADIFTAWNDDGVVTIRVGRDSVEALTGLVGAA